MREGAEDAWAAGAPPFRPRCLRPQLNGTAAAYVDGIRQTILAGGENAARGMFVGAIEAALTGSLSAIPPSWAAKTGVYAEVLPLAQALVAARPGVRAAAQ